MSNSLEPTAKIIVLGKSDVGKTSLLIRFCQQTFYKQVKSTIGFDYNEKKFEVDGQKIKLQIWDTAGQEKCNSMTQTFYKGAHGVILAYSISDRKSFDDLGTWLNQVKIHGEKNVCKIIVGNKSDLADRVVSKEEGEGLAKKHGIAFLETSAKENSNVTEVFEALAKDIKGTILDEEIKDPMSQSMKLKNKKLEKSCWDGLREWFSNLFTFGKK